MTWEDIGMILVLSLTVGICIVYEFQLSTERRERREAPEPDFAEVLNQLAELVHQQNEKWWVDLETGRRLSRNKGELIALMHSELSECLEGERKSLRDTHLPARLMAEVELADTVIRILDYAAGWGYDLGGALVEKLEYNKTRADHQLEARRAPDGKKF